MRMKNFVGGTAVDIRTTINAGFRSEAELRETGAKIIVHNPREILEQIIFS